MTFSQHEIADSEPFQKRWVDGARSTIGMLLKSWPLPWSSIIPVELTKGAVQAYLSGKTLIPYEAAYDIAQSLRLEWEEGTDGRWWFDPTGPYVLKPPGPRKAIELYDRIARGGDLRFSFEVLPMSAGSDPSWRYLVLSAWGQHASTFMFPSGSKTASVLDAGDEKLIRFQGEAVISDRMYQEIINICAQACSSWDFPFLECLRMGREIQDEIHIIQRDGPY